MLLAAPGMVTALPWNGIRVTGLRGVQFKARLRARQMRGVGFIHSTAPAMPGTAQPAGAGRFFDRGLGAAVTWSIASPQIQGWARTAKSARMLCDLWTDRTSTFDFQGRGWYRLSLMDTLAYCLASGSAWRSWKKYLRGESSDAGTVLAALSVVGDLASQLTARLGVSIPTVLATLRAEMDMMQAERDMYLNRDAPPMRYIDILNKGGRLIQVRWPGSSSSIGVGVGGYVAIGAGVLAVLAAGGYALSRRRQSRLAGALLAA